MGNAACTTVRVVNGDGVLEEYAQPVTAGEMMADNPGQFVCDSGHLSVGGRVPWLAAEEELEWGRLYFLLPSEEMLFSVLTEEELGVLSSRASSALTKKKRKRRIFPVLLYELCLVHPAGDKRVVEEMLARRMKRLSRRRSWAPALDTIEELQ